MLIAKITAASDAVVKTRADTQTDERMTESQYAAVDNCQRSRVNRLVNQPARRVGLAGWAAREASGQSGSLPPSASQPGSQQPADKRPSNLAISEVANQPAN